MFYYPNVLQRHTGCFSTIWLAATKGIKISRREYLKVNVRRTCEDIVDYVMVQVPPVHPSLPRPRFSLYLSSQLQYGVVMVYHRQCAFLLEEVQQTIERLLRAKRHLNIDMPDTDRIVLNVPDSLFQLEEAEWALEPFFGVMGVDCELPSPYLPSQHFIEGTSPLVARKEIASPKGLIASSESITIKDAELVPVLAAEFGGAELPEATAQEIDMLMEQQDQFHLDEEDKERERATEADKSGDLDPAMVSIEQLKNSECIVDEGNGRLTEVTLDRVAMEMTPPPITMPPTTEASERDVEMERSSETLLVEQSVPPKRRGRKRQLIFVDQNTQISQDAMRQQINNPLIETQSLSETLLSIPASRKASAAVLLNTPCNLLIHPDLQVLWKCCSVSSALSCPSRKRQVQEESELLEMEMEKERGTERSRESSREVVRESGAAALALSELSAGSDVPLDVSKGDKSQSDLITPTSRWSPIEEAPVSMEVILEEHVELPQGETEPGMDDITSADLLRLINIFIKRFGKVCFHSLLPPEAERSTAAHLFYKILELLCSLKLSACQNEAFGVITITLNC
ncbi:meiotic recombination protein REC8 homolog [Sinocyclocheilus anshuiensis]|uniref:meiotic recombination protein REC8 homolog n=1 Tax=Sinocyclocheilus anshuiensis TaxID=1608454 RepID=UPI0007B86FF9|nr:PREDICTED: meiotic recombination protein REC8 homolog [Sinocyclocheilus anshuiensis]